MVVAEKIKKLRETKHLTQEQLANKVGVSKDTVVKWETNELSLKTEELINISNVFNCSLSYLLKDEIEVDELDSKYTNELSKFNQNDLYAFLSFIPIMGIYYGTKAIKNYNVSKENNNKKKIAYVGVIVSSLLLILIIWVVISNLKGI